MTLTTEQTVGQLVAENPARAYVFEKHRIDYCCGGKITLAEACQRRKVDYDTVVAELAAVDASGKDTASVDWTKAPLGELADHIVSTHHAYLKMELPRLEAMSARVSKVHGDHAPEVNEIYSIFLDFRRELEEHTIKEEQILFPWIKKLEAGEQGPFVAASVANPIRCMEQEHDSAGAALERFRELTNNYEPPADACNTWRVLYASLDVLEQDMHAHVHKENSILFPRALALEESQRDSGSRRVHL
jgi:regulator of cell morphogenesis and NO signaling